MHINNCPKCGRKPVVAKIINGNYELGGFQIYCDDCGLHTGCIPHYVDAVEKWNEMVISGHVMHINNCPKCGVEPHVIPIFDSDDEYCGSEVECYHCRLHTGCCETENEAILKWNEMTKGE
jgi:transcription elongation factor Elf1